MSNDIEDSLQIFVNSKYANVQFNNYGTNSQYILPYITASSGHYIYISVINAVIPYSFYNINLNNNYLYCTVHYQFISGVMSAHDESYYIDIGYGNYNAVQLAQVLSNMSNWTPTSSLGSYNNPNLVVTYSAIYNKFTFKNTLNLEFDFSIPYSTCFEPLGLSKTLAVNNASFGYSYTSFYTINLATVRTINISTNFSSGNLTILKTNNYNTLCSIPVLGLPNSLISYENPNDFKTNLYVNEFNNITILLTDQDGNKIDLNGQYYTLTLQIDILKFT